MKDSTKPELLYPTISAAGLKKGDDFAVVYRAEIAEAVKIAIQRMIIHNLNEIPVFIVKETDTVFQLDRDSMAQAVDGCIEYFKEVEMYETCGLLLHLKKQL
ncbi:hypothetical protein UFOVP1247_73 [uncultured Caudovirales phage]|jgi:hypothetical protein|uniref:Uncharacterized protein n=1 Tax=uncultured Caudovirales phage TaxID=2100421 RepID=A0A6J5PW99_9CAUD|nr:hypothetical protein UFOVP970_113 [uncultured Caudovirales phage]CAB4193422.1 hypothetical protein UFOVP1247_73 [uncultured Caudovirales phage]